MHTEDARRNREVQSYIEKYEMDAFLNRNLLAALRLFRFPKHASIFIEQAEPTYLYFLVQGQLQCTHFHMNGKPAVIALTEPFAAIGDLEIMNNVPVYSSVIATRPVELLGIAAPVVNRYGAEDARFLRFLVDQLREKLYRSNSIQATQVLPVSARLATYILSLPGDGDIPLPDKESLASMLGTTARHLNRVLRELIDAGALEGGYRTLRVADRIMLQEAAELD